MSDSSLLMTQQEIAEKAGISQQMVSSITAKVGITSLNSPLLKFPLTQDVEGCQRFLFLHSHKVCLAVLA
jgi:hypothetical protein